jgi:hypothetical protein
MEDFSQEFTQGKIKDAMKLANAGSSDLWMVPPHQICIKDGFNIRTRNQAYEDKVLWLMEQISVNGFDRTKPIPGFVALEDGNNVIYAIGGHRRMEAVQRLIEDGMEIDAIPMVMKPRGTSMEDLTVDLYTDNESDPVDMLGQATAAKRMIGFGTPEKRIAERMGWSLEKVNDLLSLASAPSALRQLVAEEKVAATVAIDTIKKHGDKALDKLHAALAKSNGKVTAKHLDTPEILFKKYVKKQAPVLFNTLIKVQADPGFQHLSEEMQILVLDLVHNVKQK